MGIFTFCGFPRSKSKCQNSGDIPCEVHTKTASKTHIDACITEEHSATESPANESVSTKSLECNSSTEIVSEVQLPEVLDPTKKLLDKKKSFSTLTAWQILAYNVVNSNELAAIPEDAEHDLPPPPLPLPLLPPPEKISKFEHHWSADRIENHYELLDQIGSGAFGRVYKAKRRPDGAHGALACVKIINTPGLSDTLVEEVATLRALRHPHIVCLYGAYCDNEQRTAIAMELCSGDLEKWLKQRSNGNNSKLFLSEAEIMHCFLQILIALQHVHSHGILHRDIKSSNIFLSTSTTDAANDSTSKGSLASVCSGSTSPTNPCAASTSIFDCLIKLGDFGISKSLEPGQSCAKTMVGTPCYFSPELINDQPYNKKSDVWAAGCVLYELCAVKRPFQGNSVSAVCVKILAGAVPPLPATCSPEIVKLVGLLLTKDPRKRPSINSVLELPFVQKYVEIYKQWREDRWLDSIEEEITKMREVYQEQQQEQAAQTCQFEPRQTLSSYPESAAVATNTSTSASSLGDSMGSSISQVNQNLEAVTVVQRVVNNKISNSTGSWGGAKNRRLAEGECREELDGDIDGEVQYVFAS